MREQQIETLIKPAVEALGCELWGLQIMQGKRPLLRIYIDTEQGAGIEDCERVSRQLSRLLDVEDPFSGEYTLEVSSPGMDRPLFTLEQFARYQGSRVQIRLRMPFNGQRKFQGTLVGVEANDVVIQVDDIKGKSKQTVEELLLPMDSIERANIIPVFN
jgi:ribosome maturation factor RimP